MTKISIGVTRMENRFIRSSREAEEVHPYVLPGFHLGLLGERGVDLDYGLLSKAREGIWADFWLSLHQCPFHEKHTHCTMYEYYCECYESIYLQGRMFYYKLSLLKSKP